MCATSNIDSQNSHVNIESTYHYFKSWSQLSDESHGGFLTANIIVPLGAKNIELALYSKDGKPNPNLLFVTPFVKMPGQKPKEMTPNDFKVLLQIDEKQDLRMSPLNYWPKKPSKEMFSATTWNKQSRLISIGPQGSMYVES